MLRPLFSLLTANRAAMASEELAKIAQRHHCPLAQVVFRFAISVGMIPLTGTSDAKHMKSDLEVFDLQLEQDEISRINHLVG